MGKKGVENKCLLEDKQLASILKKLYHTNDSYLFSYLNDNHESRNISVNDVNQYLDEFDITNKDKILIECEDLIKWGVPWT